MSPKDPLGALENDGCFRDEICNGVEVPGVEQIGEEVAENRNDLRASPGFRLCLEDIVQHREHVFIEVLLIFSPDLILQVVDLLSVEEVERRLEVRHVDGSLGPRGGTFAVSALFGKILLDRSSNLLGFRSGGQIERRGGLDGFDATLLRLCHFVANAPEVRRPEQRAEVVLVFVREGPGLLNDAQEGDDLLRLHPRGEGNPPDSVPEQGPRKALRFIPDRKHDLRLPFQAGLGNAKRKEREFLPHVGEPFLKRLDRLLTDRVVGKVHGQRAQALLPRLKESLQGGCVRCGWRSHFPSG